MSYKVQTALFCLLGLNTGEFLFSNSNASRYFTYDAACDEGVTPSFDCAAGGQGISSFCSDTYDYNQALSRFL
jgi:hypothetical protein